MTPAHDLRARLQSDPAARREFEERLRGLVGIGAAGWLFFGTRQLMAGGPYSAAVDLVEAVVLGSIALLCSRLSVRGLIMSAHLTVGVACLGVFAVAMLNGQSHAVAGWLIPAAPMFAAYQLGMREALIWGSLVTVEIVLIGLSTFWIEIPPELPPSGVQTTLGRIILTVMVTGFAVRTRRAHDRHLAALHRQGEELARARDEALQAAAAKSRFLANMSHEVRTPINGVVGLASALQQTDLTPLQRDLVNTIVGSGGLLIAIVDDVLNFSRLESDRVTLEAVPFDLEERAQEVVELLAQSGLRRGLDVAVVRGPGVPDVLVGDPTRLVQVLSNLVGNALKFTAEGSVRVDLKGVPGGVEVAVTDTGVGIEESQLERLFQPFEQLDSSTTRRHGGAGLGLAISQRLVELMGGTLTVTSRPGQGSRFAFVLPTRAETVKVKVSPHLEARRMHAIGVGEATRAALQACAERYDGRWVETVEESDLLVLGPAADTAPALRDGQQLIELVLPGESPRFGAATSFNLPLRCRSLTTERADQTRPSSPREQRSLRVLVVEDNLVNQKVAGMLLSRQGHQVTMVSNGQEAVEACREGDFDVVLMDLHMPEMDGLEATRQVRRLEISQPRILVVTADVLSTSRSDIERAGADDLLTKPLRTEALRAALQEAGSDGERNRHGDVSVSS